MGKLLFIIGMLILGLSAIAGMVDAVYLWAHDMELPKALWDGVLIWLKFLSVGIVLIIISMFTIGHKGES